MPNFSKDKSGFQMNNPMDNVTGVKGKTNDLPDMVGSYSNESPEGGDVSPLKGWFGNLAKKALDPLGLFKKNKGGGGGKGGDGAHTHGGGGAAAAPAAAPAAEPVAADPAADPAAAAPEEEVAPQ